ncbi:hypothetical protein PR048_030149 [Dryococelus australis]|uniref:DM13 domain-containing protein n=1 Tax=Dryococelus australis TaxID=614101 RepID=A0ABQ9G847_9NEOP|nr:hypothetical protein PR048_030149 [Dryococelus australis]
MEVRDGCILATKMATYWATNIAVQDGVILATNWWCIGYHHGEIQDGGGSGKTEIQHGGWLPERAVLWVLHQNILFHLILHSTSSPQHDEAGPGTLNTSHYPLNSSCTTTRAHVSCQGELGSTPGRGRTCIFAHVGNVIDAIANSITRDGLGDVRQNFLGHLTFFTDLGLYTVVGQLRVFLYISNTASGGRADVFFRDNWACPVSSTSRLVCEGREKPRGRGTFGHNTPTPRSSPSSLIVGGTNSWDFLLRTTQRELSETFASGISEAQWEEYAKWGRSGPVARAILSGATAVTIQPPLRRNLAPGITVSVPMGMPETAIERVQIFCSTNGAAIDKMADTRVTNLSHLTTSSLPDTKQQLSLSAGVDRSLVRDLGHPDGYQLACGGEEKLTPSPLQQPLKIQNAAEQTSLYRIPPGSAWELFAKLPVYCVSECTVSSDEGPSIPGFRVSARPTPVSPRPDSHSRRGQSRECSTYQEWETAKNSFASIRDLLGTLIFAGPAENFLERAPFIRVRPCRESNLSRRIVAKRPSEEWAGVEVDLLCEKSVYKRKDAVCVLVMGNESSRHCVAAPCNHERARQAHEADTPVVTCEECSDVGSHRMGKIWLPDLLTNSQCDKQTEDLPRRGRGANPQPLDYMSAILVTFDIDEALARPRVAPEDPHIGGKRAYYAHTESKVACRWSNDGIDDEVKRERPEVTSGNEPRMSQLLTHPVARRLRSDGTSHGCRYAAAVERPRSLGWPSSTFSFLQYPSAGSIRHKAIGSLRASREWMEQDEVSLELQRNEDREEMGGSGYLMWISERCYGCADTIPGASHVWCEEDEVYRGKYLGKINSYHHQVSGDVYAVDEYTLLFINFNYDGNGADAFFWAGAANRPGPEGFIVPDEYGKYVPDLS